LDNDGQPDALANETEYFRSQSETEQTESVEADQEAQTAQTPAEETAAEDQAEQEQNMTDVDGDRADQVETDTDIAWDSQERRDQVDAQLAEAGVDEETRSAHRHIEYSRANPPQEAARSTSGRTGARTWRDPSAGRQRQRGQGRGGGRGPTR
jgi:hypothetical protein